VKTTSKTGSKRNAWRFGSPAIDKDQVRAIRDRPTQHGMEVSDSRIAAKSRLRSRRRTRKHPEGELLSQNHALDLAPAVRILDVPTEQPRTPVFRRTVRGRPVWIVSIQPAFGGAAIGRSQSELFYSASR
jgi:hypothetical protein